MTDTETIADVIVAAVRAATAPLVARITELEARPALLPEVQASLRRLEALELRAPVPGPPGAQGADGPPGPPGRDGTLEGLQVDQVDDRTWRFVRADGRPLPGVLHFTTPIDRGVYAAGRTYEPGDGVTANGSWWIAQEATSEKPGDGATKWRLAVKLGQQGREGKPGKDGAPGPRGERGEPGRDYR